MIRLPAAQTDGEMSLERALATRRSVRSFGPADLTLAELSQLLWAVQGQTSAEGGRTTPSAGALYPIETYVVVGGVGGLPAGIYRYRPAGHGLEAIAEGDRRTQLRRAALEQEWVEKGAVSIVVAGVRGRTEAKYGKRARRYVWMEVGHAVENLALQAVAAGLGSVVVGSFDDYGVHQILKMEPEERPLCIVPVGRPVGNDG